MKVNASSIFQSRAILLHKVNFLEKMKSWNCWEGLFHPAYTPVLW